jgi:SagB-type dehydrogenase family enzyme
MNRKTGRQFLELTKYSNLGISDQVSGVEPPRIIETKDADEQGVKLPQPDHAAERESAFLKLATERTSLRKFSDTPYSLEELSYLLWSTQGVKQVHGELAVLKTVPSAGARHAFETYLMVNRIESLKPGIYKYAPLTHSLVPFEIEQDLSQRIVESCHGQAFVRKSAVTFFWVAYPYRMTWRYEERGYRYLFIDAGHVCQNLYLASEAIGGGTCAVAAFDDDALNELFKLDPNKAFVIYLAATGKR